MNRILFNHAHLIIDGNKEYLDGGILVNGETIEDVFPNANKIKEDLGECRIVNAKGAICMPGFFDTHIHGYKGIDFNNAKRPELDKASHELTKVGTTSFLTTLTNNVSLTDQLKRLETTTTSGANFMGVHIEGPFISKNKRGIINPRKILEPNVDELNKILDSSTKIKQMTVAPELKGSSEIIKVLNSKNIKVMLGHSNAIVKSKSNLKYDGFTHLFNCCSGFHHRELGLVNLAFNDEDSYKELICDGIHVDESVLKVALNYFRKDRIIIVSDATYLAGQKDGGYLIEGERCFKEGKLVYSGKDKSIAGGCSTILDGVKTLKELGASYTDLLLMSSLNAYRLYGLDHRYGSLIKGKSADLVFLNSKCDLILTYSRGEIVNV